MGDAIFDNVWDGEKEIDFSKDYQSEDGYEDNNQSDIDIIGANTTILVDNSKTKKRLKHDLLKQKKKLKSTDERVDNFDNVTSSNDINNNTTYSNAMTTKEMINELLTNQPANINKDSSKNIPVLLETDLFYPELLESSTTKSLKKICPFTRALSANLPTYKTILFDTTNNEHGCPIVLILCSSAIRATQIIQSISSKLINIKIAKLFSKHIKINEQMEMLNKTHYNIAIGTPNRVKKLLDLGSLSLKATKIVLIDMKKDIKMFNILTLKEVKYDFYQLLYESILLEKSHLKIALIN